VRKTDIKIKFSTINVDSRIYPEIIERQKSSGLKMTEFLIKLLTLDIQEEEKNFSVPDVHVEEELPAVDTEDSFISIKLKSKTAYFLKEHAKLNNMSVSDFINVLILSYLELKRKSLEEKIKN